MTLLYLAFRAGLASASLWLITRNWFERPHRCRTNVRGALVPVGAGVLLVPAAAIALVTGSVPGAATPGAARAVIALASGLTVLGLIDDWWGDHEIKGFRGHLGALRERRFTTGTLKMLGGGLLAVLAVGSFGGTAKRVLLGALIVSLAANAANLFDRAPGRTAKVSLLAGGLLVLVGSTPDRNDLAAVIAMLGALVGLVWFDLGEELMLGDAGSNAIGGVLGLGVVLTTSPLIQVLVLGLLVAINLAGERISFSSVIAGNSVLRELDQLGRLPEPD